MDGLVTGRITCVVEDARAFDVLTDGAPVHRERIVRAAAMRFQQRPQAARVVEVLHEVLPAGRDVSR